MGQRDLGRGWTLFSTSVTAPPGGLADYFLLPPNVGPFSQEGLVIEEVHVLRDEMANMAWAVEFTTENGLGKPWLEVPREGVRISGVVCRVRGSDGATYLWVARRKEIGRGEGSSGLRFDLAVENGDSQT